MQQFTLMRVIGMAGLLIAAMTAAVAIDLNGAGATFPYPLYSKWIEAYGQQAGTRINYQAIGSGGGIKQLQAGTVDFGASDAPLSADEAKAMPGKPVTLPMCAGAVAVAYNLPSVKGTVQLDPAALAGIFLGEIRTWDDPKLVALNKNAGLPRLPITVVHRADGSGTSFIFTDYLSMVSPTWKTKVGRGKAVNWPVGLGGKGSEGVSALVKQTAGAVGYFELAYALQNKLSYAALKNADGKFVMPSLESTTAAAAAATPLVEKDIDASIVNMKGAKSYPIAGFTYIMLLQEQKDAAKGKALVDYLWWAIHGGQRLCRALLYSPLPQSIVTMNEKLLKGVASNGKPLKQ